MFVLTQTLQPENIGVAEIRDGLVGKTVTVDADLAKVSEKNNNLFMTLQDGDATIRAVYWSGDAKNAPEAYELKPGDSVSATGQVVVYRGDLEIIIKKISKNG